MFNVAIFSLLVLAAAQATPPDAVSDNPVLQELLEKGVSMSDG